MKWKYTALSLLLTGGLFAATPPSDLPDQSHSQATPPTTNPVRGGEARRPPPAPLSEQQLSDAEDFLKTNSPNRYKAFERLRERAPDRADRMQQFMARGYVELQALKGQDSKLYDLKLEQLKLEDKIFGIIDDARTHGTLRDRPALREQLRQPFADVIKNQEAQVQHRIDRMQKAVDKEREHLQKLEALDSTAVDQWMERQMNPGQMPMGIVGNIPLPPHGTASPQEKASTTNSVNADTLH